jgi:hypothetical protein
VPFPPPYSSSQYALRITGVFRLILFAIRAFTAKYACSKAKEYEKKAQEQLKVSDLILDTDLLAIYQPKGWEPMNKEKLDYFRDKERLRLAAYEAGPANTSIYYQNNRRSTAVLYVTDAPEAGSGTNP